MGILYKLTSFLGLLVFAYSITASQVLVYLEIGDDLTDVAYKSLSDMALVGPAEHVRFCVQIHTQGKQAWRYRIERNTLVQEVPVKLTTNTVTDIIHAARWAFTQPSAEHILILYGHGHGILNPVWHTQEKKWVTEPDIEITCPLLRHMHEPVSVADLFYKRYQQDLHHQREHHRAVLLQSGSASYVQAHELTDITHTIAHDMLGGKKLALLGMDACMMSMVEVAYQVSPYVDYLVGSQDCELKDGWDYAALINGLNRMLPTRTLVQEIVTAFEQYYAPRAEQGRYTQSALALKQTPRVLEALNKLVTAVQTLDHTHRELFLSLARKARAQSPHFCFVPMYTDLIGFCQNILRELTSIQDEQLEHILPLLVDLSYSTQTMVLASCAGTYHTQVHGVSIYCPYYHIDSSYSKALFAQHTRWTEFLQLFIT